MKNLIIVLILIVTNCIKLYSQEIAENKTDEFTKAKIVRTSWEKFCIEPMVFTSYFRISDVNNNATFDFKMMKTPPKVFSIAQDDPLMFMLENDSIIKLYNKEFTLTCVGCGAIGFGGSAGEGIYTKYPINKEQLELLIKYPIKKIRIYTNDGYLESIMQKKHKPKVIKASELILSN